MIGGVDGKQFLFQMQRLYDRQLIVKSTLESEDSEVSTVSRRREAKATRKATRKTLRLQNAWTEEETEKLLEALSEHGRDWAKVALEVGTKSKYSVRTQTKALLLKLDESEDFPGAEIL